MTPSKSVSTSRAALLAIVVAALGYFVDIYDLLLFSVVRVASLRDLGLTGEALTTEGIHLINMQMLGMLVGGLVWGVIGDKRGRLSVLFGSILLYSIANLLNGSVTTVTQYAVLRFIAGVGLAGELGAGITLVAELLPKEKRGYGTTAVAAFGILGAVLGAWIGEWVEWRVAYRIGGAMGLMLLLLRVGVLESGMYQQLSTARHVARGSLKQLFSSSQRVSTYISCVLIGVPIWFVIGVLITFAPEFGIALGIEEPVRASRAVMYSYAGLSLGDLISGMMSQWLGSRRRAVIAFLGLTILSTGVYLGLPQLGYWVEGARELSFFYGICGLLGVSVGYWAVFITIAAEQFGTNLRATVATSVPNFVRGSVVLLTSMFQYLRTDLDIRTSAFVVGLVTFVVAGLALRNLRETYGRDLDFFETS